MPAEERRTSDRAATDRVSAAAEAGGGPHDTAAEEPVSDATRQAAETRVQEEIAALGQLGGDVLSWLQGSVKLMGTEARLFLASLLLVVALAAMAGLLIAGAFIFLGAAAVLMLVREGGISPPLAAFIGAVALCASAVAAYAWIRRVAREMGFARTRKSWAALFRSSGSSGSSVSSDSADDVDTSAQAGRRE